MRKSRREKQMLPEHVFIEGMSLFAIDSSEEKSYSVAAPQGVKVGDL
jgi:hypothetical protein